MQSVDVLRDHRLKPARPLQLGQLAVGGVGLSVQAEHFFPVELKKALWVGHKIGVAQNRLRRLVIVLVVQPVHAAEIRNTRLRGHPRAAEKDNTAAFVQPLLELLLLGHGTSPPDCPAGRIQPSLRSPFH